MKLIGLTTIFAYNDGYPGGNGSETLHNTRRDLLHYASTGELPEHVVEGMPLPRSTLARSLVGLPIADAILLCGSNGHSARVASEDGSENIFSAQFWSGIWLTVERGLVTEAEAT